MAEAAFTCWRCGSHIMEVRIVTRRARTHVAGYATGLLGPVVDEHTTEVVEVECLSCSSVQYDLFLKDDRLVKVETSNE